MWAIRQEASHRKLTNHTGHRKTEIVLDGDKQRQRSFDIRATGTSGVQCAPVAIVAKTFELKCQLRCSSEIGFCIIENATIQNTEFHAGTGVARLQWRL